jgi:DNA-binding MarR family transcriptional regulator
MSQSSAAIEEQNGRAPAPAAPEALSKLLGFHLRMAHAALQRDFTAAMAEIDLTQKQFAVLQIVEGSPGASQVDIAALLGADRATMMAMVDRLQARGLLERRRSAGDRRRQELHVTGAGAEALARSRAVIAEHEKTFTERFTGDELAALFEALRRIHGQV